MAIDQKAGAPPNQASSVNTSTSHSVSVTFSGLKVWEDKRAQALRDKQEKDRKNTENMDAAQKAIDLKKVTGLPLTASVMAALSEEVASEKVNMDKLDELDLPDGSTDFRRSVALNEKLFKHYKTMLDIYQAHFPGLETFLTKPIDYAQFVAILLNKPLNQITALADDANNMVGKPLSAILTRPMLMQIALVATTTNSRYLEEDELDNVTRIAASILRLDLDRTATAQRVEVETKKTAPNLVAFVGVEVAAQLLNSSGGLKQLSLANGGNIRTMGSRNAAAKVPLKSSEGRDQGCIFDAPLMSNVALEHLDQAGHQVGAKVVLVARVDLYPGNTDGSYGEEIKQQCLDKFDKTARPAPNAHAKALPAPDEKPSAKRGGKKVRKAKEATAMTEMRKAQNRIGFNKEEVEVGYGTGPGTVGMGMIGQENAGGIRKAQVNKATAAKLGKHHQGWGSQAQQPTSLDAVVPGAGLGATRGLRAGPAAATAGESTVLFAPAQSLQLADPNAEAALKRKREDETSRWFGSGVFTGAPAPQKPKTGPFKFPDLPEPKRAGETKEKPAE